MKSTLVKITPDGMDPEFMVVTTGSTAHESMKEYAKMNAYPIEEHACANRFQCILQDLKRIEETIEKYAPIILKLPAFDNAEPYNNHLSECFSNIEIACDEEASEVEHEWLAPDLPTYEEYTKGWSLKQKLEMYYEADIEKLNTDVSCIFADFADAVNNAEWLSDFEERFKGYLQEREYIR